MGDPLICLRGSSIAIAIWNIIYSIVQMGVMGWQLGYVRERMYEYENRYLPSTGVADGLQNRFPGLYAIYTETPERRRINAMYVIVIICLILAIANFLASILLLYGCIKRLRRSIFPWFFTCGGLITMSTVYACLWWSGDIFNEQLVMSVAEFVMSLAVNGICFVVVVFYYARLSGGLTSDKPAKRYVKSPRRVRQEDRRRPGRRSTSKETPGWREDWDDRPPKQLAKKMKRNEREREMKERKRRLEDPSMDFYAPEAYDSEFPWKLTELQRKEERTRDQMRRPMSAAEVIRDLYYEDFPDEESVRKERLSRREQRHRQRQRSMERHREREYLSAV